jgi:hypothetical protein
MSKDLWFAEYERQLNEAEDRLGRRLTRKEEDAISDGAYDTMREKLFDKADHERKRRKEEG